MTQGWIDHANSEVLRILVFYPVCRAGRETIRLVAANEAIRNQHLSSHSFPITTNPFMMTRQWASNTSNLLEGPPFPLYTGSSTLPPSSMIISRVTPIIVSVRTASMLGLRYRRPTRSRLHKDLGYHQDSQASTLQRHGRRLSLPATLEWRL